MDNVLKPGTTVKLSRKSYRCTFGPGQWVPSFFVGSDSQGRTVIEVRPGMYMIVPAKRLAPMDS